MDEIADEPDTTGETVEAPEPLRFRVLHVESVVYDFGSSAGLVTLYEPEDPRNRLVLPVALADATAIHQAWRKVPGRRPTSAELTVAILGALRADVVAARIVRREDGVYYAELDVMSPLGRQVLDARPSDAITLALRQAVPAPILAADELF